jgi:hypothetical protein
MVALAVALVAIAAGQVAATPISGLFNTGVNSLGLPLAAGAIDPHYTLIASDDPAFPGPNAFVTSPPLPVTWIPNTSTGQWISPNTLQFVAGAATAAPTVGDAAGTYIYQTTFDVNANPKTVSIAGAWAVGKIGLIELNVGSPGGGYVLGTTNLVGPGALTPFAIPVGSPFVAGINTLDFVVINTAAGSTGLQVQGLTGNQIPEPSTVALAAIGFVGLVALRYRRSRKH